MHDNPRVEELPLPEQLYLLLTDPNTGAPAFAREAVGRALGMAVVWELLQNHVVLMERNQVIWVDDAVELSVDYLLKARRFAGMHLPITGSRLATAFAEHFAPLWQVIGATMVDEHLLRHATQERWLVFHRQVLTQLDTARRDHLSLSSQMRAVARNLWDTHYDDELAQTHPRLLARFIILDNYRLLHDVLGAEAYAIARKHMPALRQYLREAAFLPHRNSPTPETTNFDTDRDPYAAHCSVYDDGCNFWVNEEG